MRALIRAWESSFAGTWGLFALAAIPSAFSAGWALVRLSSHLSAVDYAEWAVLTVATTVLGSISQLGLKPGYMQYVTDHGKAARYPGLAAAMLTVGFTGFIAGLALLLTFSILAKWGSWNNTGPLPWLGLMMAAGNITMMLHTDLRILGKSSVIAAIAFIQVPLFVGLLELGLKLQYDPLTTFYAATTLCSLVFIFGIGTYSRIGKTQGLDTKFLKWAIIIGLPAMGALLSKYASDLTVSAAFRWLAPENDAGLFGFSMKLIEPLMALYIGSFQMAWGAFIYGWIKAGTSGSQLHQKVWRTKWFGIAAFPAGLVLAYPIWINAEVAFSYGELSVFFLMSLSRAAAFGISSPMGVGQTIRRNYKRGLQVHLIEFFLTAVTIPSAMIFLGTYAACAIAGLLPWITVLLLSRHSLFTLNNFDAIYPPVSPKAR